MKKFVALMVSAIMILAKAATVFAASAEVTWEDYQQYLIDNAGPYAPDLQEFIDQVYSIYSWEELDQTVSPWDTMFTTIGLSTWEEFERGGSMRCSPLTGMGKSLSSRIPTPTP